MPSTSSLRSPGCVSASPGDLSVSHLLLPYLILLHPGKIFPAPDFLPGQAEGRSSQERPEATKALSISALSVSPKSPTAESSRCHADLYGNSKRLHCCVAPRRASWQITQSTSSCGGWPGTPAQHRCAQPSCASARIQSSWLGTDQSRRAAPGSTGQHREAPGSTGKHRAAPGSTGQHGRAHQPLPRERSAGHGAAALLCVLQPRCPP